MEIFQLTFERNGPLLEEIHDLDVYWIVAKVCPKYRVLVSEHHDIALRQRPKKKAIKE